MRELGKGTEGEEKDRKKKERGREAGQMTVQGAHRQAQNEYIQTLGKTVGQYTVKYFFHIHVGIKTRSPDSEVSYLRYAK